jgi:hypothetical protein
MVVENRIGDRVDLELSLALALVDALVAKSILLVVFATREALVDGLLGESQDTTLTASRLNLVVKTALSSPRLLFVSVLVARSLAPAVDAHRRCLA